ncbi:MAG: cytochrome c [Rhodospirillaceae bacterium]|nr:cytochrome c [Rhodospirillaceae bacterium]
MRRSYVRRLKVGWMAGRPDFGWIRFAPVVAAALFVGPPALAQDSVGRGQEIFKEKGNCQFCHAWHGNGDSSFGNAPPSLRTTNLNKEQLMEVVSCGRIGTTMPSFDTLAYTDDRCYGVRGTDIDKKDRPPVPQNPLTRDEIGAVADYVLATFVGKGEPTYAECQVFWGGGNSRCDPYKK